MRRAEPWSEVVSGWGSGDLGLGRGLRARILRLTLLGRPVAIVGSVLAAACSLPATSAAAPVLQAALLAPFVTVTQVNDANQVVGTSKRPSVPYTPRGGRTAR